MCAEPFTKIGHSQLNVARVVIMLHFLTKWHFAYYVRGG